tara:strand:+ start:969 stop:1571 length:603 start_codon:yes stop_codon:yes gene_type:complete
MPIPVSQLQSKHPDTIIELFQLELLENIHFATGNPPNTDDSSGIYYFHNGTSLKTNGKIRWNSKDYLRYPVQASGFEFIGAGTLPRPQFQISNALNLFTALISTVNTFNIGNDLVGAKFTRIRTLLEFIDVENFANNINPFGSSDPTQELPKEIFFLSKKLIENRQIVSYELISALDLANVKLPKRIATRKLFPGIGGYV